MWAPFLFGNDQGLSLSAVEQSATAPSRFSGRDKEHRERSLALLFDLESGDELDVFESRSFEYRLQRYPVESMVKDPLGARLVEAAVLSIEIGQSE